MFRPPFECKIGFKKGAEPGHPALTIFRLASFDCLHKIFPFFSEFS